MKAAMDQVDQDYLSEIIKGQTDEGKHDVKQVQDEVKTLKEITVSSILRCPTRVFHPLFTMPSMSYPVVLHCSLFPGYGLGTWQRKRRSRLRNRAGTDQCKCSSPPFFESPFHIPFFQFLIQKWAVELNARPEDVKRSAQGKFTSATYTQTVEYLRPLTSKLKNKVSFLYSS